jgi:hypothetical protein
MDLPDVEISSVLPDFCGKPMPPKTECYSCTVVEKVKSQMTDKKTVDLAIKTFIDVQMDIQHSIDNVTGCMLGHHFSLSIVVVATPSLREDESLDLSSVVSFHPLQNVLKPTKDHKRVFCPCVKKFLTKLANFSDSDVQNQYCEWADEMGTKRSLLQSGSGSNSMQVSLNFPSNAVKRVFASEGNFTKNGDSASSTVATSVVSMILVFLAGKLLGA